MSDLWPMDPDMKISGNDLSLIHLMVYVLCLYFHCFIRWIRITMRLLRHLNLFPAEEGLRSATGISNLSERLISLTNDHNSLMTSRILSPIFVVLQMECAECEWTSELGRSWHSTLRLRVEDLTPGKLAEAEKKAEQSPAGRWGREKERTEVFFFDLPRTGQVCLASCLISSPVGKKTHAASRAVHRCSHMKWNHVFICNPTVHL